MDNPIPAYQGKLIKDRTGYHIEPRDKQKKYSRFHVLINPVRPLDRVKDRVKYEDHKKRLGAMGEFLLEDETIKSYLKFPPTEGQDEMPRSWHLDRIVEITNKEGSLEDSSERYKRAHLHYVFDVVHETKVQVDPEKVKSLAGIFFKDVMNPDSIYVHVRATNAANFFLDYIRKNKEWVGVLSE